MSEIILAESSFNAVSLISESTDKGMTENANIDFKELFYMGAPQAVMLSASLGWMDDDLKRFISDQEKVSRFYLVHLACDFKPRGDARVSRAWVKVSLNRSDGGDPKPLAWSMDPMKVADLIATKWSAKLSVTAQLIGLEAGAEETGSREEVYQAAHGLKGSDPYWDLKEKEGRRLEGQVILKMVVSVPVGFEGNGVVTVDTAVAYRKLLLPRVADIKGTAVEAVLLR